jgi:hypothetical protein
LCHNGTIERSTIAHRFGASSETRHTLSSWLSGIASILALSNSIRLRQPEEEGHMTSPALPGTRPARRPVIPQPPSGVPQVEGRDSLERLHNLTGAVRDAYVAYRNSIPQDADPDELKDRAGEFAYSDAALALPAALSAAKADTDAAAQAVRDKLDSIRVDPTDQAAQLAAQRYWTRTKATLDAARSRGLSEAATAAQQAVANAAPDQVNVLAEELADWLDQNGVPGDWLPEALVRKAGLGDDLAAANLAQKRYAVAAQNVAALQRAMSKDVDPQPLLSPYAVSPNAYTNPADL